MSSSTLFSEFSSQLLWQECYEGELTLATLNDLIARKADINYQNPEGHMNSCVYNIFKHSKFYDTFNASHWEHKRTVSILNRLIELKADFNLPNLVGQTVSHVAACKLDYACVDFLLPHLNFLQENNQGADAVVWAIRYNYLDNAALILDKIPAQALSLEKIQTYKKEFCDTLLTSRSPLLSSASKKNSQQILGELLDKLFIQVEQLHLNKEVANSLAQFGALNIGSVGSADKLTQKFKI